MSTIGKLFGRSPFSQMQMHMEHVSQCVQKMKLAIDTMVAGRYEELDDLAYEVSRLCLLYTSPSPRDKRQSRMPSSA